MLENGGHGCFLGVSKEDYEEHGHYDTKNVPILDHEELLAVGDGLEIDGIDNVDERIARAVWLTMKGVDEFIAAQRQSIGDAQILIQEGITRARVEIREDLS